MNGSDVILGRIKSDCDQRVNAIEREAEQKRESVLAEAEKQAQKLERDIADKTSRELKRLEDSAKSRSELERRNALLKRRRAEIDKTIDSLSEYLTNQNDGDYFESIYKLCAQLKGKSGEIMLNSRDLARLPGDFEQQVKSRGLDAAVSQTPAKIGSGFILKSGDIEENMEFAAIISARRDELEDLINRELFAQ